MAHGPQPSFIHHLFHLIRVVPAMAAAAGFLSAAPPPPPRRRHFNAFQPASLPFVCSSLPRRAVRPSSKPRMLSVGFHRGALPVRGYRRALAGRLQVFSKYETPPSLGGAASSTDQSQFEEKAISIKLPRRSLLVQFTCNACGERTERTINRTAYERGTVFVQCAGCLQHHKLVDNLGLIVEHDLTEDKD